MQSPGLIRLFFLAGQVLNISSILKYEAMNTLIAYVCDHSTVKMVEGCRSVVDVEGCLKCASEER